MPYMQMFGPCIVCDRAFAFNPLTVPSTTAVNGQREPICRDCIELINERRQAKGLKPFPVAADAYDAAQCLE